MNPSPPFPVPSLTETAPPAPAQARRLLPSFQSQAIIPPRVSRLPALVIRPTAAYREVLFHIHGVESTGFLPQPSPRLQDGAPLQVWQTKNIGPQRFCPTWLLGAHSPSGSTSQEDWVLPSSGPAYGAGVSVLETWAPLPCLALALVLGTAILPRGLQLSLKGLGVYLEQRRSPRQKALWAAMMVSVKRNEEGTVSSRIQTAKAKWSNRSLTEITRKGESQEASSWGDSAPWELGRPCVSEPGCSQEQSDLHGADPEHSPSCRQIHQQHGLDLLGSGGFCTTLTNQWPNSKLFWCRGSSWEAGL